MTADGMGELDAGKKVGRGQVAREAIPSLRVGAVGTLLPDLWR
jgi:hypothetical protein